MQNAETLNPNQISQFLTLGDGIEFAGQSRAERYVFAQQLLVAQEYVRQGKKQRGAIRAYLSKMTGLGMAQTARLIRMYLESGSIELRGYARHQFANKYTGGDVRLLANVDRAHERLSGPATCCILRREYEASASPIRHCRVPGRNVGGGGAHGGATGGGGRSRSCQASTRLPQDVFHNLGDMAITASSARVGASGRARPCSQFQYGRWEAEWRMLTPAYSACGRAVLSGHGLA